MFSLLTVFHIWPNRSSFNQAPSSSEGVREEKVQVLTLWHSKMCLNHRSTSPCLESAPYPRIHKMVFCMQWFAGPDKKACTLFFFKATPDSLSQELLPSNKTHLEHMGRASSHLKDSGQVEMCGLDVGKDECLGISAYRDGTCSWMELISGGERLLDRKRFQFWVEFGCWLRWAPSMVLDIVIMF